MRKRSEVLAGRSASDPGITPAERTIPLFQELAKDVPELANAPGMRTEQSEPGTLPYWYISQYGPTQTRCTLCQGQQQMVSSGVTCAKGHVGADGIDDNGRRVSVTKGGMLVQAEAARTREAEVILDTAKKAAEEVLHPPVPKAAPVPVREAQLSAVHAKDDYFRGRADGARPTVTVTWGKELYAPVQYNNFEVGPFTVTRDVAPGETYAEAQAKAYADAKGIAERTFDEKAREFFAKLEKLGKILKARGGAE